MNINGNLDRFKKKSKTRVISMSAGRDYQSLQRTVL